MSTAISTLGGVGLFLLGMTVMTEGLKTLAGSALRGVLGKVAIDAALGSFWEPSSRCWCSPPARRR